MMRHITKTRPSRCLLVLSVTALIALVACSDEKPSPGFAAPATGARPAAGQAVAADPVLTDSAADSALADTYIYTPVGKRDPFKSAYKDVEGKKQDVGGPMGPLQRYEIDQLKLVAVVSGIAQPRAMVTAPDGKGYTVKIGTRIGKNFGRVVRIKTSEVIIAEDYRDWNGRKVTNYIHMSLKKDEKK